MSGWGELLALLGRVIVWWVTRDERNRAELIARINRRQEGWKDENGDIFGGGDPAGGV